MVVAHVGCGMDISGDGGGLTDCWLGGDWSQPENSNDIFNAAISHAAYFF